MRMASQVHSETISDIFIPQCVADMSDSEEKADFVYEMVGTESSSNLRIADLDKAQAGDLISLDRMIP